MFFMSDGARIAKASDDDASASSCEAALLVHKRTPFVVAVTSVSAQSTGTFHPSGSSVSDAVTSVAAFGFDGPCTFQPAASVAPMLAAALAADSFEGGEAHAAAVGGFPPLAFHAAKNSFKAPERTMGSNSNSCFISSGLAPPFFFFPPILPTQQSKATSESKRSRDGECNG